MNLPANFKKADAVVYPRLVLSVEGLPKHGKTHLALTAPDPIAYLNLDNSLESVIHKFATNKQVFVSNYDAPVNPKDAYPDIDKTIAVWQQLKQDFMTALSSGVRTVVVDTCTEMYELVRLARLGKLSQVQPFQYGLPNYEFKALLDEAVKNTKVNTIFLHKMKDKYVKEKRTGEYERAGYSGMSYIVQAFLRVFYDEDGFNLEVLDSRHEKSLAGMVLTGNDVCTYQTIASMLLPSVDPDAWV